MSGKVLKIKTGFNPNSSSIGTNLTPLILGGIAAVLAIPLSSFLVARRLRRRRREEARAQPDQAATRGHSGSGASDEPVR